MNRLVLISLFAATAAVAQDPLSNDVRAMWNGVKNNVMRSAEKVAEAEYAFKPSPDVRSFGQLVGHVADTHFAICSAVKGEAAPQSGIEKGKTTKADLVAALKASNDYCDAVYTALTDTTAAGTIKMFGRDRTRLGGLAANASHTNEHYGNLVTYMRIKGIVPPSSEPRPR